MQEMENINFSSRWYFFISYTYDTYFLVIVCMDALWAHKKILTDKKKQLLNLRDEVINTIFHGLCSLVLGDVGILNIYPL